MANKGRFYKGYKRTKVENKFKVILNDVSELEAPEPLIRTINILPKIKKGSYMKMIHRMRPCNLFDALGKNGYGYFEKNIKDGVEIFIYLADDEECKDFLQNSFEKL